MLGNRVESIGSNIFEGCEELKSLTCLNPIPPHAEYFENYQYVSTKLYVPESSLDAYRGAEVWKEFFDISAVAGIGDVTADGVVETGRYDLNGMPIGDDYDGCVIIRYSDGSVLKKINRNLHHVAI